MAADVDIVNLALTKLGSQRITTLTDNVKAARSANAIYAITRDSELRAHQWNFATKRVILPALASKPVFGFQLAYELPVDCLKVIQAGDTYPGTPRVLGVVTETGGNDYQIEGTMIVTNRGTSWLPVVPPATPPALRLRYTARITDPNMFDSSFVEAFAMRLAMDLAEDLTQQIDKRKIAQEEYKAAIMTALRANAIELPPDTLPDNTWLLARLPG